MSWFESMVGRALDARPSRPRARVSALRRRASLDVAALAVNLADGRRDYRIRRLLAGSDVIALSVAICSWLVLSTPRSGAHIAWGLVTLPVWLLILHVYGLYAGGLRRVGYATVDDIPALAHALLLGSVGMWLFFQVTPAGKLRFSDLLVFVTVAFALALLLRFLARGLARKLLGMERVMFVGSGPMTPILVRQMVEQRRHGLQPVAVLTQPENEHWPLPLPEAGMLADVDPVEVLRQYDVERVIISAEGIEDDSLLTLIDVCRQMMIKISALPSLAAMIGPAATIDHLEGITLIGINTPTLARSSRVLKRAMDIVGASILLLCSLPILIAITIAIKLNSRGPVLFRQNRVGRGGKPFKLTKFRSMDVDAEARRAALVAESRQPQWLDLEHDPRITRVGRYLRLWSLDELPQLWDVLRGEMSLVGPRPLIEEEDNNVSGWARGRLDLTPGITGMWQVFGRTRIPFDQMIMIDYLYVSNWSLWTDIKLIIQTIPVILKRSGAN